MPLREQLRAPRLVPVLLGLVARPQILPPDLLVRRGGHRKTEQRDHEVAGVVGSLRLEARSAGTFGGSFGAGALVRHRVCAHLALDGVHVPG